MAKKTKANEVYEVTFHGIYYAHENGHNVQKSYEAKYRMTQAMIDRHSPEGVWKNFGAREVMPRLYPDFQGLATYKVKETVVIGKEDQVPADIRLMNRDELIAYIAEEELPVDVTLFIRDGELRQAIRDAEADEDQFLRNQAIIAKRVGKDAETRSELSELNESLIVGGAPLRQMPGEVEEPKLTKAEAKELAAKAKAAEKEAGKGRSTAKSKAAADELAKLGL